MRGIPGSLAERGGGGFLATRRELLLGAAGGAVALSLGGCGAGDEYAAATARLRAALATDPGLPELLRYATLAANSHNTQPWRFAPRSGGVSVLPDFSRRTPAVDPDDHHLFVSLGCAIENLLIAAAASGRAAAVATRPDRGVDVDFAAGGSPEPELFQAIPLRQSTRTLYEPHAVRGDVLRQLEAAARIEGVGLLLLTAPERIEDVVGYVVAGNSAQMDDAAFFDELLAWIRFDARQALETGDGLYAACSGNPELPPWLGRRLFPIVFRKGSENDRYASHIRSSSGIAVFCGDRADPASWIRVGRSFQRFALKATALGLRHAHVNQPVEVAAVRREFARWLGLGDGRPDLVVRFGHAAPLPMSLRRPVAAVLYGA